MASAHAQRLATQEPAAGRKICAYMRPESGLLYDALLVNVIEGRAALGFFQNKERPASLVAAGRFKSGPTSIP